MSVLAAKCPCCGRDIGIQENSEEYTCVFCGTSLKVAALKTERIDTPETRHEEAQASPPEANEEPSGSLEESGEGQGERASDIHGKSRGGVNAPELSEEEIEHQLKRKAEFKEELHSALHQIDELRARRPKLEARLRTVKTLGLIGAIVAVLAGAAIFLLVDGSSEEAPSNRLILIAAAGAAVLALVMLITAAIRIRDINKQKSRLEESIIEKKQKRDILIGRLNKINKMLHIHSSEHSSEK